jgi:hypothetical protein
MQVPPVRQVGIGQEWSHVACYWADIAQVGLSALHSFVWCPYPWQWVQCKVGVQEKYALM